MSKTSAERRKHPRFIKRLTTTFFVDQNKFTGISSDLSESGLFIRTSRGVPANTPIHIELMLPNNTISSLRGIVRRTLRTSLTSKKNGMGVEITEKDEPFNNFVKSLLVKDGPTAELSEASPDFQDAAYYHSKGTAKKASYLGHERRRHKRLQISHLQVKSEMLSASVVNVINISMNGVLIKADRRLDIGRTYIVKIGYKEKAVLMKTMVAWSLLVAGAGDSCGNITPCYIAGMQFTDTQDKYLEELLNSIDVDMQNDMVQRNSRKSLHEKPSHHNISSRGLDKENCAGVSDNSSIEHETVCSMEFTKHIEHIYRKHEKNSLTYYEILDISDSAVMEEIKKAYYKKIKVFHPDRYPNFPSELREKLTTLSAYLNEAYKTLITAGPQSHCKVFSMPKKQKVESNKTFAHQEFEKGKIEFWNGNFSVAEKFFQISVSLDNSSGKYFYYFAKTLFSLGKLHDAEKTIREALKLDPSNADYLVEAGHIYQSMNLSYRARENFELALRVEPTHIKAREGITALERKNGNGGFLHNIANPFKAMKKTIAR